MLPIFLGGSEIPAFKMFHKFFSKKGQEIGIWVGVQVSVAKGKSTLEIKA